MQARQRVFSAAGIAMTATFVGVIAAMGLVPAVSVPGFSVPITIQSMGVMLAGSILGRWRGAAAVRRAWRLGRILRAERRISAGLSGRRLRDRVAVRAAQRASVAPPL